MINIINYIKQLVPSSLVATNSTSYLRVILSPVDYVCSLFQQFKNQVVYKLSKNSQICYFESLLNNQFDNTERRIFITDAESIDMLIAYEYLDIPKHIIVCENIVDFADYQVIAYKNEIIGDNLHKFIINVPNETPVVLREDELRAFVNRYRLAGKLFYIIYF